MKLYLGIDGGQSSTTALVCDARGRILGRGSAGPCNHVSGPEARAKFLSAVQGCIEEALRPVNGGDPHTVFAACCMGFSGGAQDKAPLAREAVRSEKYKITHDAAIALAGAMGGQPGVVVIAGTGSMAFGRDPRGRTARAGGWGYVFGDEGGAFDLARQALRAALRSAENWGPGTVLLDRLLAATGARDAHELLHRCYAEVSRSELAKLAPLVTSAAEEGDASALEIVGSAARHLATYARGVHSQLFADAAIAPVAPVGGVFRSSVLRQEFGKHIVDLIGAPLLEPRFTPVEGALFEALQLDGIVTAGLP